MGVCAWARALAVPRHSWLGCWVVCVLVCVPRLQPATPGWGVRCGCVCFGSGFGCTPRLLAGVLGCVCACLRAPHAARHSWLGCAAWVLCLGSGLGCAPPLLAGVSRFVSACVRAPLAPRHCWLGCAVWVCVFGLGVLLSPATPGWGVVVCVFVCMLPLYPAYIYTYGQKWPKWPTCALFVSNTAKIKNGSGAQRSHRVPSPAPPSPRKRPTPFSTASDEGMGATRRLAHVFPQGGHDGPLALPRGQYRRPSRHGLCQTRRAPPTQGDTQPPT